jgi:hypothetical protein
VKGFPGAKFRGFPIREEAVRWLDGESIVASAPPKSSPKSRHGVFLFLCLDILDCGSPSRFSQVRSDYTSDYTPQQSRNSSSPKAWIQHMYYILMGALEETPESLDVEQRSAKKSGLQKNGFGLEQNTCTRKPTTLLSITDSLWALKQRPI